MKKGVSHHQTDGRWERGKGVLTSDGGTAAWPVFGVCAAEIGMAFQSAPAHQTTSSRPRLLRW